MKRCALALWVAVAACMILLPVVGQGAGTLVIAQSSGPLALDLYHDPAIGSHSIVGNMLEALTLLTSDLSDVVFWLATSIESTDPRTWIVHLRQGVTWHDGKPFTSEDVVFTFNLMEEKAAEFSHKYPPGVVEDVIALDQYTVKISTETPYAVMLRRLSEFPMLPKHVIEAVGTNAFSMAPVGTGAYKFEKWIKDESVTLVANKNWWGGTPIYDKLVFRTIPDATTRMADLLAGTIDLMEGLNPDLVDVVRSNPALEAIGVPGLRCMALYFNPYIKPLDDTRVRQAICYAINREPLIRDVLRGYGVPSYEQEVEAANGFTLLGVNKFDYNLQKARELLAQAGYASGFKIDLQLGRRFSKDLEIMQVIQDQLADVGIKLNVIPMEWGTYYSQYYQAGTMTMGLYGFSDVMGDAELPLFYLYHSKGQGKYYHNPELDELIAAEQSELDPCVREQLLHSAMRLVVNDAATVNLFRYTDFWGQKKGILWYPRIDGLVWLFEVKQQ